MHRHRANRGAHGRVDHLELSYIVVVLPIVVHYIEPAEAVAYGFLCDCDSSVVFVIRLLAGSTGGLGADLDSTGGLVVDLDLDSLAVRGSGEASRVSMCRCGSGDSDLGGLAALVG